MKQLIAAAVLSIMAATTGCHCAPGEVPVSLEGIHDWWCCHGPACREYPYSCPTCPYYDYHNEVWRSPYPGQPDGPPGPMTAAKPAE